MRPAQFRQLLETHGADRSRWPLAQRGEAEAYLAADPRARAQFEDADRLDKLIRAGVAATCPRRVEASVDRVTAALAAPLPPQRHPRLAILRPVGLLDFDSSIAWRPIAALAVVALLGFAVGLSDGRFPGAPHDSDLMSTIFEPDLLPGLR